MAIKREELTGFRKPTRYEIENIYRYMNRRENKMWGAQFVWLIFCGICAFFMLSGSLFGSENRVSSGIFGLIMLSFCIYILNKRSKALKLLRNIREGRLEVLECGLSELNFNPELNAKAAVKISDECGNVCSDDFTIDSYSAAKYKKNISSVKIILMKCDGKYEIFSDARLGTDLQFKEEFGKEFNSA